MDSRSRKGFYTILSTFFFIVVLTSVTVGLIYYGSLILSQQQGMEEQARTYVEARNMKDRILQCYDTDSIQFSSLEQNKTCPGDYRIEQLNTSRCEERSWEFDNTSIVENTFTYNVLIEHAYHDCPARLTVVG